MFSACYVMQQKQSSCKNGECKQVNERNSWENDFPLHEICFYGTKMCDI